jgi:hypothetical protein
MALERKTFLVSAYYEGNAPSSSAGEDDNDYLYLNDAIKDVMNNYNPESNIIDVAIDDTKPRLFSMDAWFSRYIFRLLRK